MSPVVRLCRRHGISAGACEICAAEKLGRQQVHTHKRGRKFRLAILERDNWTCAWCGSFGGEVDYIEPLSENGAAYDPGNAVAACRSCNSRRGGGASLDREMARAKSHPRHFSRATDTFVA